MWRRPNVWIVVTVTAAGAAAITMTGFADRDSCAEPRVTTRTPPVVPQRRILRSEVNLGRSVRGRSIRAIVLGDPNATRPVAGRWLHPRRRDCRHCRRGPLGRRATTQTISDLDHPRSQPRRCGRRHPAKRAPRRSQPQRPVPMATARALRRPAIRRTTGTLRAREPPRTHADPSPPASTHNLVPPASRHHRSIRRRRPNRGPLRRPQPIAAHAATALPRERRDMAEPPTLGRHRVRR
jgi:hypothetical protein